MFRNVMDLASSSAQPNWAAGGSGYYNSSSFQAGPNIEGFDAQVIDNRASASSALALGTLYVEQITAANNGDAFYIPSATAAAKIPLFKYGVMTGVPAPLLPWTTASLNAGSSTGQNEIRIRQLGSCNALCTTGATAIAVGTPLIADGAGNLTAAAGLATAPTIGTVTTFGTAGSSTVTYTAYARNANGLDSAASAAVSVTTANAALSPTNGDVVPITIPAGTTQVVLVRTVGGPSQGVIAIAIVQPTATSVTLYDNGQAAQGAYAAPTVPNYPAGSVLAIAKGALAASTATPTLVLVDMGGY